MTWHVVCLAGPRDTFRPTVPPNEEVIFVPIGYAGHEDNVSSSIPDVLAAYGLAPAANAIDFLNAAIAGYTADLRVPRTAGYDNWTRDIVLYIPVADGSRWSPAARVFEELAMFLTGDHWNVWTRDLPQGYSPPEGRPTRVSHELRTNTAILFSGGLDSFIGAVDLLSAAGQVALVGHHSLGGGPTSSSQARASATLARAFGAERMPFLQFWVSPPKGRKRSSEITTRGRSLLFLSLGIAVASGLPNGRLVVPENGLISLNVPLTNSRLGSFSTRTTHPYLIAQVRRLVAALGIDVDIQLPYRFKTKGEMIRDSPGKQTVLDGIQSTMSCAHPGASRFAGAPANQHCGYCLPCLIRRAAVTSVTSDPTTYTFSDLRQHLSTTKRADIRAVKMALDIYSHRQPNMGDILVSGPLPVSDADLAAYLNMYFRGIQELGTFVRDIPS